MKEFKFFVITDTHYYSKRLEAYGKGYDDFMEFEQKCFAETAAINDAVFKYLCESDFSDTVLIVGDLSFNGERKSHEDFSALLKECAQKGLRTFVVTAGHDIEKKPFSFPDSDGRVYVDGVEFSELLDFYGDFGYRDAIAFNEKHLSYVAELNDEIRLLVICNDTAEGKNITYDDEFFMWIEEQAKKAKSDGKMMLAMEHYPVISGQPILSLIGDANIKRGTKLIETLADNGVHLIFTGHMHNQSINVTKTEKGNIFYDVCTGSAIGCPAFIREVTVRENGDIDIKSVPIPDFEWDTNGKTCKDYLQGVFDGMILNLVSGMVNNPEKLLSKLGAGGKKKLYPIIRIFGKIITRWTSGKLCRLLLIKCAPEVKNVTILDFIVDLVRNVFCGDQEFVEGTPMGDTFLRFLKRFSPILKIVSKKLHDTNGRPVDLFELLKHSAGNYGVSDYEATLRM